MTKFTLFDAAEYLNSAEEMAAILTFA